MLHHFGDGMLFRVPRVGIRHSQSGAAEKTVAMEHFWLCSKCAETMTLGINRHGKVGVIPLRPIRDAAA